MLLYADQTAEAHLALLRAAFRTEPPAASLKRLAARTLSWTAPRPQPRIRQLVQQLHHEPILKRLIERHGLLPPVPVSAAPRMRPLPGTSLLRLESIRDLADWLKLEPGHLQWFADLHDLNRKALHRNASASLLQHYTCRILAKPYGAIRLLEIPAPQLRSMQRRILHEILAPIPLHPAVHGFRRGRSILTFTSPHAAREAVLRIDLQEFFPSISGPRVQALFRTLGYPEPVADLLGGLCTTTTPRSVWRNTGCELSPSALQHARVFYARPHLPQGAPTSPAIANLCAFRLDRRVAGLAAKAGATYTRYADDLAFSGDAHFARAADRFMQFVTAIVTEEGFHIHPRKTKLMRRGVRQHLAGLTLNTQPNLPRREMERLEAILTNCVRKGPTSQNRDGHADFRRHLEGKVAFATMVHPARSAHLRALLAQIQWPSDAANGGNR
ncbi:reverse transcriptase family protein [Silvibacterium sp.]|uniref:reverse transcriptase family protein n=1 Tax=Silvibacterium sp. TaxID=1964179 RepID=UPI0039E2ED05